MYRYDNYTDSFVRIDGEPNTGSTTVRVGVPLKEMAIVKKVELTDECIDKIADAVVRKLADRKDEPQTEEHCETCRHKDKCEGATYEYKNTEWWCLAYAPIDELQTDCAWK